MVIYSSIYHTIGFCKGFRGTVYNYTLDVSVKKLNFLVD
jgi:hypothetical protein